MTHIRTRSLRRWGERPGWNSERLEWFRTFHRAGRAGLTGTDAAATWAVESAKGLLGSARLAVVESMHASGLTLEAGLWLSRSARGKGVGGTVLKLLIAEASSFGAARLNAETTVQNLPARAVLARLGGVETIIGEAVQVCFELGAHPGSALSDRAK